MRVFAIAAIATVCACSAAERKVTLTVQTGSINEFRKAAGIAKDLGANHIWATQIEPSMWVWNRNRKDPYPNWGLRQPTVFKFVVPDELKPYMPEDYAKRNLEMLKARAAILKEFGLKATFNGMEPAYFPEQAYLDHPEWRGPRCDQARRARFEYYAPCFDNPEIRAMYRKAVIELCKACPFDAFSFLCNDSGGGLCWCEGLYAGQNGPAACRNVPMGQRISRYLSVFQDAAREAGLGDVDANVNHIHTVDMLQSLASLKPGQSVNNRTATTSAKTVFVGLSGDYADHMTPVRLMPRMGLYARMMQSAQNAADAHLNFAFRSIEDEEAIQFVKKWFGKIKPGPIGRAEALMDMAVSLAGEKDAAALAEIWDMIERMDERFDHMQTGGHIFLLGTVHQRWLTRPFVAFPEELKPEEKEYYRAYQFQAQTEKDADNMADLQANCWLQGYGAANLLTKNAQRVIAMAEQAVAMAEGIAAGKGPYAARAAILAAKLRVYRCVVQNANNAIRFQDFMDRADRKNPPMDKSPAIREQGDVQLFEVNQLVRNEIDNTVELIRLIEDTPAKLVETAPSAEFTCVMMFEPDLVASLRRKIAIMEAHRRDFLRLYRSYNR